jgi:RNA polymerase sigma factor (sigma-70 family)
MSMLKTASVRRLAGKIQCLSANNQKRRRFQRKHDEIQANCRLSWETRRNDVNQESNMLRRKSQNQALKTATCAALIAASFAVPVSAMAIGSIERYCSSSWRQAGIPMHDWEDCTQDTMLELLSRLPQNGVAVAIDNPKSSERRELMRSVWCVAQRWRRSSQRQPVSMDVLAERAGTRDDVDELFDAEALAAAMERLNSTQRRILDLWVEGNTVAEISDQLDLPTPRVSDLKYKAIRSLRAQFA